MTSEPCTQLRAVLDLVAQLEALLRAALANREMDLVISYAGALDALTRTVRLLETKARGL